MSRKPFQWNVTPNTDVDDPLLACLELLTRYYKSPCSKQTLTAGLPLVDNKLTPSLFIRSAERAYLEANIRQVSLEDLKKGTLPAILLLKNGDACVLTEKNDDYARVLFMETGAGINSIKLDELKTSFTGVVIFVKPNYQISGRSQETLKADGRNWFWKVLFKGWPIYSEVLLASSMVNLFALAVPLFVMNVYDRVIPNNALETLWVLAIGVFIVFTFDFTLKSLRAYFIDTMAKKIDVELSSKIFSQILGVRMSDRPESIGALANTVQSFESFRDFITSSTVMIIVDLPFVLLFISVIYIIGGPIYIIPMSVLPLVIVVGLLLQWPMIKLTKHSYQVSAEKQAALYEALSGVETIKSLNAENNVQSRWEEVIMNGARIGGKLRIVNNLSLHFTMICQQLVTISVVIYGVYLIGEGQLSMGALIACTILSGRAIAPMAQIAGLITRYYQSVNALKSINKVMQLDTDIDPNRRYLHRPNLEPTVEFRHVYFHYDDENNKTLEDIHFKVGVGERIGIIGSVGAGKTTLSKLIMNLYHPTDGGIYIGGVLQDQINPSDLRFQVGYMPQDISLFYGSIKDNIIYGAAKITQENILNAAKISGADQFVNKLSEGFDFQVGERGRNLSQGQRQSIALSRALVLAPKLLLLDEPCASMDVITERYVLTQLHRYLTKDKSLILTTHKLSMLALVNRVIVMDNGKIVIDGPKEEVVKKINESFRNKKKNPV